jgi:hypothetical protein
LRFRETQGHGRLHLRRHTLHHLHARPHLLSRPITSAAEQLLLLARLRLCQRQQRFHLRGRGLFRNQSQRLPPVHLVIRRHFRRRETTLRGQRGHFPCPFAREGQMQLHLARRVTVQGQPRLFQAELERVDRRTGQTAGRDNGRAPQRRDDHR